MNIWIIAVFVGLLAVAGFAVAGSFGNEGTVEELRSCGSASCDGNCNADAGCGLDSCGATLGKSCGCGRR